MFLSQLRPCSKWAWPQRPPQKNGPATARAQYQQANLHGDQTAREEIFLHGRP